MKTIDIGIDLGTATVIIYDSVKGIVLREPSVVAINTYTGAVLGVGEEAYKMLGRTPDKIRAVKPLADGVISDFDVTEKMLKYFIKKVCQKSIFFKPRVALCVPSGITEVESKAVVDAAISAGARKVFLIEEPVAAAIGAGIDISKPNGTIILDIGGGTSDIAVLSLNGIVVKKSIKVAGNKFDEAIIKLIRSEHNILIGEKTAEKIKIDIGSVYSNGSNPSTEIKGRNLSTGLPQKITVYREEIEKYLLELGMQIVYAIQEVIEHTPPELVGDIHTNGIIMTGGGALVHGLGDLIEKCTKLKAIIPENSVECVAVGTGKSFEYLDDLVDGFLNISTYLK